MIYVKVTYTVQKEFAAKNRGNILRFLEDFKALQSNDFRYTIYNAADGQTFIHQSVFRNEGIQQQLLQVPSFLFFQQERDASGLVAEPQIELMSLVGASHELC